MRPFVAGVLVFGSSASVLVMEILAARLLGPLKMTGKQTGWVYSTLPIACIVSPLVSGLLARLSGPPDALICR